jgi:hypothetical protein
MQKQPHRFLVTPMLCGALIATAVSCSDLPGTKAQQGAAIGGVGGAATGAIIGGSSHNALLGALVGGAVGAGGGYLIGAHSDRIQGQDRTGAEKAVRSAQSQPATPQEAMSAPTADLNGDGFVTMDEVVAMKQAGFSDQQILNKMRATGQVFELSPEQQNYLRTNGLDQVVINEIPEINRETRDKLLSGTGSGSSPAPIYFPSNTSPQPGPSSQAYPQAPGPSSPITPGGHY